MARRLTSIPASWLLGSEELCSAIPSQPWQTEPLKLSQPILSSLRLLLPGILHWGWEEWQKKYMSLLLAILLKFIFFLVTYILWVLPVGFSRSYSTGIVYIIVSVLGGLIFRFFFCSLHRINTEEPFYKVKSMVFTIFKSPYIYKFNRYLVNRWGREDYDN